MSKKLPRCAHCHRAFRPNRYNAYQQECCTHDKCVLERKRIRQRAWYARRRAEDPEFRDKENARCAEANRRRRAAHRARAGPAESATGSLALFDVVTGLLSQMVDTDDPVRVRASLLDYAARGRRVALAVRTGTDPP